VAAPAVIEAEAPAFNQLVRDAGIPPPTARQR
jgi:hypothetical protein